MKNQRAGCRSAWIETLLFLILWGGLVPGATAKTLNAHYDTPNYDYRIHYYDKHPSETEWYVAPWQAGQIGAWFDRDGPSIAGNPSGAHQAYLDLGFPEPHFNWDLGAQRDVKLQPTGEETEPANATPERIEISPEYIRSYGAGSAFMGAVAIHELFHNVQYAYVGNLLLFYSYKPFATEGTATVMEDALYDVADAQVCGDYTGYGGRANDYLDYYTGVYLWDCGDEFSGYHSALFWKYLMEQFGTDRDEPHLGHDVIERFWELAEANEEGICTTLEDLFAERDRFTTAATDYGVDLDEVFQDFSLANWIGVYSNSTTGEWALTLPDYVFQLDIEDPQRFCYFDDNPPNTGDAATFWGLDPISSDILYSPDNTGWWTNRVPHYATHYRECLLFGTPSSGFGIGFWAQSLPDNSCWYSLIGVRDSGRVELLKKGPTDVETGNSFQYVAMQSTNDPFIQLIAVINGDEQGDAADGFSYLDADYACYFGYFEPAVQIQLPDATKQAFVGSSTAPERFVVRLKVASPDYLGSGSVKGLEAGMFSVYVGSTALTQNQARVLSAADVMGEYWLTCEAPAKGTPPALPLPLTVRLGSASDTEEAAVVYDFLHVNQMLVLDRSGSMATLSGGMTRMEAARAAAQLFVDATGTDDRLGIVRFNGNQIEPDSYADGEVVYPMFGMSNQIFRDLANLALDETYNGGNDQFVPEGFTSIGDGLFWGADEIKNEAGEGERWIVLLSDGHQNEDAAYEDVKSQLDTEDIRVATIALGSGCDDGLLQQIAANHNGSFYKVEADADPATRSKGTSSSSAMIQALGRTFLDINDDIRRLERITEETGGLAAGAACTVEVAVAEGGLSDGVAALFFAQTNSPLAVTVYRPNGTVYPPPGAGSANYDPEFHAVYHLATIGTGTWQFVISNPGAESNDYFFALSAKNLQGAQTQLYFAQYHGDSAAYSGNGLYLEGLPQPIVLSLADARGAIQDADITATVTHPLKSAITLRLRDGGGSYDSGTDDGVYAGVYAATTESAPSGGSYHEDAPRVLHGTYQVVVNIRGTDNFGRPFERVERGCFTVFENEPGIGSDWDLDGMPDRYEELHTCLNPRAKDAADDSDGDGLDNETEYEGGTAPGCIDSDGGGEADGSEVARGANPLDETDDALMRPLIAFVFDRPTDEGNDAAVIRPGQNIIRFSPERGYHSMNLYRSALSATNDFALLTNISVAASQGTHVDSNLVNGTRYYYYLEAVDASGNRSAPCRVFSGMPKLDPLPPTGFLIVNNGHRLTDALTVPVVVRTSSDVVEMRSGLSRDLSALPWLPFTNRFPVALGTPANGDSVTVYVQVRDAADNRTTLRDSVGFLAPTNRAIVQGVAIADLDPTNASIVVMLTGTSHHEIVTPPSGQFRIVVEPGPYDWEISQRGYQSETGSVVAVAGETNKLGIIHLVAMDRDGDGLMDVPELIQHDTDPDSKDTDGDRIADGDEVNFTLTSPTNSESVLRLSGAAAPGSGGMAILWDSVPGVTYRIFAKDDLLTATGWSLLDTVPAAAETNQSGYLDASATGAVIRTYRIVVAPP